jgi:hypothetical protein
MRIEVRELVGMVVKMKAALSAKGLQLELNSSTKEKENKRPEMKSESQFEILH